MPLLCLQNDHPQDAVEFLLPWLENPGDDARTVANLLGRALTESGQPQQADEHIQDLINRFPDQAVDIRFEWAMLCERRQDHQRSEAILLQLLEEHPDHALANNALGYTWADQNKNLDRAHDMISKAVQADPSNAALLDSMGWVLYKLGRFDEAVRWLERARAAAGGEYPVILDHLADAQYRAGRADDAVDTWQAAYKAFDDQDVDPQDDPELTGLKERIQEKINAVEANEIPAVSHVPDQPLNPRPDAQPSVDLPKANHTDDANNTSVSETDTKEEIKPSETEESNQPADQGLMK